MDENRLKSRWEQEDRQAIDATCGALLQHQGGRKLLWWLLQIGRVGTQPMSNNALTTAFACGELNVGQQILERITSVSPEGYVVMMKEMADERRARGDELNLARGGYNRDDDRRDDGD